MNNKIPCIECGRGNMVLDKVDLVGYRNGEEFVVRVPGFRCTTCDFTTIDNSQSGEFTKAVSDAYRSAHGLLTGTELKDLRSKLGMSQVQFAEYLGVGTASLKRWESGQIQDRAMDELIRLKTDSTAARRNLKSLQDRFAENCGSTTVISVSNDVEFSICSDQSYSHSAHAVIGLDVSGFYESSIGTFTKDEELVAA
jgi:HTH-type transcriptional regulator/antitoxin MqsA